jgi:hypothetical protein
MKAGACLISSILALLIVAQLGGISAAAAPGIDRRVVRASRVADLPGHVLHAGPDHHLYLLNRTRHEIRVLSPVFRPLRRIGGFGQGPGELLFPIDFAVDARSNLYVVEKGNQRLQKISPRGEGLLAVPLDKRVTSVAISRQDVFIANADVRHLFSRLDEPRHRLEAVAGQRDFPWLRQPLAAAVPDASRRSTIEAGFQAVLNKALLRVLPGNRLAALFIGAPVFRIYEADGDLLSERFLSSPGLDAKSRETHQENRRSVEASQIQVYHLFQDLAVGTDGKTLAAAVLGECPGVFLFTPEGQVVREICLVDEQGKPVVPVALAAQPDGTWLTANDTGIYRFPVR